ncbi:MAG: radical SAM protein, partial [Planctomycetota bacterium]
MLTERLRSTARLVRYVTEISGNRSGAATRPRLLTHTVTFRCNARCVMCDSWRLERQDELDLAEIDAIYSQLPRLDALRLTGGEPFVRKDLAEIAHLGAERVRPALVHVTTNVFLTELLLEFARGWDRRESLHMLVSLDGPEKMHDTIRGVPRSYERAIETLRQLAQLSQTGQLRLAVNQTVLDGAGAAEYPALRDELQALGIPLHVVVAYRESATYSLERDRDVATDLDGQFETFRDFTPAE